MINLAGREDCDKHILQELGDANIPAFPAEPHNGEVRYGFFGRLGDAVFTRAWYYWIVRCWIPIEVARELYRHPVGKRDVRVNGHCGCPSPDEQYIRTCGDERFVDNYHVDSEAGLMLLTNVMREHHLDNPMPKSRLAALKWFWAQQLRKVYKAEAKFYGYNGVTVECCEKACKAMMKEANNEIREAINRTSVPKFEKR